MTAELTVTCYGCPTQIEGTTDTGESVYFRYRWGNATLNIDGETVFSQPYGDSMSGVMSDTAALRLVHALLEARSAHAALRAELPLGAVPPLDAEGQAWIDRLTGAAPAQG